MFELFIIQWVCYIPFKFLKPSMSVILIKSFTVCLLLQQSLSLPIPVLSEEELILPQFRFTFSTCSNNIILTFNLQMYPQNTLSHTNTHFINASCLQTDALVSPFYKLYLRVYKTTRYFMTNLLLNSL